MQVVIDFVKLNWKWFVAACGVLVLLGLLFLIAGCGGAADQAVKDSEKAGKQVEDVRDAGVKVQGDTTGVAAAAKELVTRVKPLVSKLPKELKPEGVELQDRAVALQKQAELAQRDAVEMGKKIEAVAVQVGKLQASIDALVVENKELQDDTPAWYAWLPVGVCVVLAGLIYFFAPSMLPGPLIIAKYPLVWGLIGFASLNAMRLAALSISAWVYWVIGIGCALAGVGYLIYILRRGVVGMSAVIKGQANGPVLVDQVKAEGVSGIGDILKNAGTFLAGKK